MRESKLNVTSWLGLIVICPCFELGVHAVGLTHVDNIWIPSIDEYTSWVYLYVTPLSIYTEKDTLPHWHSLTLSITYAARVSACFNTSLKLHDAYTKWNIQIQDAMFLRLRHYIKWKSSRCLVHVFICLPCNSVWHIWYLFEVWDLH